MSEPITQYYEYKDDNSSKFWEITWDDTEVTTRYGKIGTDGQSTEKSFDSHEAAEKEFTKLVKEKTKKGYELVNSSGVAPTTQSGESKGKKAVSKKTEKKKDEMASRIGNLEGYEVWDGDLDLSTFEHNVLPKKLHIKGALALKGRKPFTESPCELVVDDNMGLIYYLDEWIFAGCTKLCVCGQLTIKTNHANYLPSNATIGKLCFKNRSELPILLPETLWLKEIMFEDYNFRIEGTFGDFYNSLPVNHEIRKHFGVAQSQLVNVPDNGVVEGSISLPLEMEFLCSGKALPKHLHIKGDVYFSHARDINLDVDTLVVDGNLFLDCPSNVSLAKEKIGVQGKLSMTYADMALFSMPTELIVKKDLVLDGSKNISLPEKLAIGGVLSLYDTENLQLKSIVEAGLSFNGDDQAVFSVLKNIRCTGDLILQRCEGLTTLPDGLQVGGNLDLTSCEDLVELPKGLRVEGNLILDYCRKLTRLPEGLYVGGNLTLMCCEAFKKLPESLYVGGNLKLQYSNITEWPESLRVGGGFYPDKDITTLPKKLHVGGDLQLWDCFKLQELPEGLHVGRDLNMRCYPTFKGLPDGLYVGRNLRLESSCALELPNGLHVGGNLEAVHSTITRVGEGMHIGLAGCDYWGIPKLPTNLVLGCLNLEHGERLEELGENLTIENDLDLTGNKKITKLPANLKVGGTLFLNKSAVTEIQENVSVGALQLGTTKLKNVAPGFTVNSTLSMTGTKMRTLPAGMIINGDLDLRESSITAIPESIVISGAVIIGPDQVIEVPSKFTVRGIEERLNRRVESKRDYLENKNTSLFWEIELQDAEILIRSGKIGFDGEIVKTTQSSIDDKTHYAKLLSEKQKEAYEPVKKLTRAFDIFYSDVNLNQGWAYGQPVGIKMKDWPRENGGALMKHLFTVWVPHEYRVAGEQYVAVSVFQGDDTDGYMKNEHPTAIQITDHLDTGYTWIWLTQEEFCGVLTPPPESGEKIAPRFITITPRKWDPNVGKEPDESMDPFGDEDEDEDESYDADQAWVQELQEAGKDPHEEVRKLFTDEEYAELLEGPYIELLDPAGSKVKLARFEGAWAHFGGTIAPDYAGGAPSLASPYFIEIEHNFGGANFGGGVGQIDLGEEEVQWSCG